MKIPARCNKRTCQARRNLGKRPEAYVRWPSCHLIGCQGKMYVDEYRLRKGPKDNAPVCRSDTCNYVRDTGKYVPFHRINTRGCIHYGDYVTARNMRERSRHSPIPATDWVPL